MYRTAVSSLAIALSAPAVAQETTGPDDGEVRAEQIADERRENPVDSIIVVGGRIDPYRIAGSADLIDSEDLRRFDHGDVNRVLRQVPGVNTQEEDGFGLFPNIGLRGSPVERSSNITLMEDGVLIAPAPYAAPAAYYFPAIGRMQAVEVTKGAAAIRYGPRTIGGAVNLRSTDIPADGLAGYASGQYGSRDYYQGQAWVGGDTDYVGALLETYQQGSDGFKTIDGLPDADTGFERQDYRGRLAVHTAPDAPVEARLEFVYGRSDLEANETYLGLADTDFAAEPYRRYAASQRDAFSGEHDQYRVTGSLAFSDGTRITATLYRNDFARSWSKLQDIDFDGDGSFDSISSVFVNPEDNAGALSILRGADSFEGAVRIRNNNRVYRSEGAQISLERPFEMGGARHNLAVSVRYHEDEEDRLQNEEFYSQIGGDLVFERQTDLGQQANREAKAKAIAFYIEDRIEIGALTLTPGLRYEGIDLTRLDYAGSDPDRSNGPTRVRQTNIDQWLPGLGATYELGDAILLAGVSRGFSPPGPGNPDARAEESWNYEAGVRYRSDKVQVSAIGFYNDYSNLLGNCTQSVGCSVGDIGDQFNGGAVTVKGLELSAAVEPRLSNSVSFPLSLAYTFTDAEFDSSFDSEFFGDVNEGDDLPYIARHQLYVEAGVNMGRAAATVGANYVSELRDNPGSGAVAENERIDDRIVFDIAGSYALTDKFSLFARVDNVLDNQYAVSRRPFGLRPGVPRRIVGGARVSF